MLSWNGKLRGIVSQRKEYNVPPGPIRFSRDVEGHTDLNATQQTAQPVAITQMLDDNLRTLEQQFQELDTELRRRFGDHSYSVDRSEQVLGAIQRLRWAIARSPVVNPIPASSVSGPESENE